MSEFRETFESTEVPCFETIKRWHDNLQTREGQDTLRSDETANLQNAGELITRRQAIVALFERSHAARTDDERRARASELETAYQNYQRAHHSLLGNERGRRATRAGSPESVTNALINDYTDVTLRYNNVLKKLQEEA